MKKIIFIAALLSISEVYASKINYISTDSRGILYFGYNKIELGLNSLNLISKSMDYFKQEEKKDMNSNFVISYLLNRKDDNQLIKSTYISYLISNTKLLINKDYKEFNHQFQLGLTKDYSYELNEKISLGLRYNLAALIGKIYSTNKQIETKESSAYYMQILAFNNICLNIRFYLQ